MKIDKTTKDFQVPLDFDLSDPQIKAREDWLTETGFDELCDSNLILLKTLKNKAITYDQ